MSLFTNELIFKFRISFLVFFAFFISHSSFAQYTLKGQVLDSVNNEPLPLATIYLNNTTIGTSSDLDGIFSLSIPAGNYEAVISYTGYKTVVYRLPAKAPETPLIFNLIEEEIELDEVSISSKRDPSWFSNLQIFKKYFLGESTEARKTKIENEEDIIIDHNKSAKQLNAMAKEPLVIINEALGYRLSYRLEHFFFDFNTDLVSYIGYPFFEELDGNARQIRRWERARESVYEGSFMHFARILIDGGNPNDYGFQVRPIVDGSVINEQYNSAREVSNPQEVTIDSLLQPHHYFIKTDENRYFFLFKDKLEITYDKKRADYYYRSGGRFRAGGLRISTLGLQQNQAELDVNGSFINPFAAIFEGYWGWEKIGNVLPLDYQSKAED
tara:strand:+ start:294 stop:1445 length:1152 start_codon:yes stop_codon:yes gene_type:complete